MRNRTYGGVRGRKTKVGEKLLRFPPTRLRVDVAVAVDAVEVGEVDVEDAVAVARSDTQFGYHLVGNDRGFHPHVCQSLGRGGDDHDEGGYGC